MKKQLHFIAYEAFCSVEADGPDESLGQILSTCRDLAYLVQDTLNMYDENSELSVMCRTYQVNQPYPLSDILYQFIKINLEASQLTEGVFDFTVGGLKKSWNFVTDCPAIPTGEELTKSLKTVGYQHLHLTSDQKVVFDIPGVVLDPGASGKGLALDLAVEYLKGQGIRSAKLDFGGQLYLLGGNDKTAGEPWKVGIKDPHCPGVVGSIIEVIDVSVATSSWYEHFFEKDGVIYSHIMNPADGKPVNSVGKSISVIGASAVWADILSTAVFLLGIRRGELLMNEVNARYHAAFYFVSCGYETNYSHL